jgi:hypothetical protein
MLTERRWALNTNADYSQSRSDAYGYSQPKSETSQQRNGYGSPSSPVNTSLAPRSRSPTSHSNPKNTNGYSADPASPTNKALNLTSSPARSRPAQEPPTRQTPVTTASSMSSILNPEPAAPQPSTPAASSSVSYNSKPLLTVSTCIETLFGRCFAHLARLA